MEYYFEIISWRHRDREMCQAFVNLPLGPVFSLAQKDVRQPIKLYNKATEYKQSQTPIFTKKTVALHYKRTYKIPL
jgi:hypothetical protein